MDVEETSSFVLGLWHWLVSLLAQLCCQDMEFLVGGFRASTYGNFFGLTSSGFIGRFIDTGNLIIFPTFLWTVSDNSWYNCKLWEPHTWIVFYIWTLYCTQCETLHFPLTPFPPSQPQILMFFPVLFACFGIYRAFSGMFFASLPSPTVFFVPFLSTISSKNTMLGRNHLVYFACLDRTKGLTQTWHTAYCSMRQTVDRKHAWQSDWVPKCKPRALPRCDSGSRQPYNTFPLFISSTIVFNSLIMKFATCFLTCYICKWLKHVWILKYFVMRRHDNDR